MRRTALVMVCTMSLSACMLPRVPNYSTEEIKQQSKLPADLNTSLTLEDTKRILNGWRSVYAEAQDARTDWKLAFSEMIFYGSIFAVLGVATHHDRLRNVGAGIAGTSSLLDGHYQMTTQRAAFRKAESRTACMEKGMMHITPQSRDLFGAGLSDELRVTLTDVPTMVVGHLEFVRNELRDSLYAISLSTPSRDDIISAYKSLLGDLDKVEKQAAAQRAAIGTRTMTPEENKVLEQRLAFIGALTKLKSEMELCVKT